MAEPTVSELGAKLASSVEDVKKRKLSVDDLQAKLINATTEYRQSLLAANNAKAAFINALSVDLPEPEVDGRAGLKVVGLPDTR
jgi:hypothetical protein